MRRTHRCIVVNEGCKTGGYASEVAASVGEAAFEYLDAPILRVASEDVPMPANVRLEGEVVPQEKDVIAAVYEVLGR